MTTTALRPPAGATHDELVQMLRPVVKAMHMDGLTTSAGRARAYLQERGFEFPVAAVKDACRLVPFRAVKRAAESGGCAVPPWCGHPTRTGAKL